MECAQRMDLLNGCQKHPGHKAFIKARDLSMDHLPEGHKDPRVLESLQSLCRTTCRVLVPKTSLARPSDCPRIGEPYPFSVGDKGFQDRTATRAGTGFVSNVFFSEKKYTIQKSSSSEGKSEPYETRLAQIVVTTARHVVFDQSEAKSVNIELFYDDEDKRDTQVKILKGWGASFVDDLTLDVVWISCLTDDLELARSLWLDIKRGRQLQKELTASSFIKPQRLLSESEEDSRTDHACNPVPDSPTGLPKAIERMHLEQESGQGTRLSKQPAQSHVDHIKTGGRRQERHAQNFKRERSLEDCEKRTPSPKLQRTSSFEALTEPQPRVVSRFEESWANLRRSKRLKEMQDFKEKQERDLKEQQERDELNAALATVNFSDHELLIDEKDRVDQWAKKKHRKTPVVNNLMVIVSHPHGACKHVTFGHWTQKEVILTTGNIAFTRYIHNVPTCPGSSGSPVWQRNNAFGRHVHSRAVPGSQNVTSIGVDHIPPRRGKTQALTPSTSGWNLFAAKSNDVQAVH